MNDRHERFVEELLNQMPQLSSEQYLRYRHELDDRLARARREEKSMRWIVFGACLAALTLFAGVLLLSWLLERTHHGPIPDWILLPLAAAVLLLPLSAVLLLALYLFKYRRNVNRARAEGQKAALGELQRQLNELRAQLLPAQKSQTPPGPK